jgi:alkylation response protein AidB-like acyl-CoA dehydrogenase
VNFAWDPEQQAFRATVREFIASNLPTDWESLAHGPGSALQTGFSKKFCAALAVAGLLVPHWPRRWGGRDADPWIAFIVAEEMWAAGEPRGGQYMNVNWIGPTLMRFGTDEQQERYIPPMARGETLWCQGFSEPEAGSDLASLRTRAEKHGSGYRINGQKIWTSYAGDADTCFLLARTSLGKDGISIFLIPMDSPGIIVRQIPSIIGEGDIHEVFLDDLEVPRDTLLGAEGQAWEIARTALSLERVGIPRFALAIKMLHRAVESLKAAGRFGLGAIEHAAKARAACEAARFYSYGIVDQRRHGQTIGPEASAARFATVTAERLVSEFIVEHVPEALSGLDPMLLAHHQRAIVAGIASGAAEIQLNLIATELLHLPREPR